MNHWQEIYVVWVALIFWVRDPNPSMWIILANMVATLAACEVLDLGWLRRDGQYDEATAAQMLIDLVSLCALMVYRGLPKLVACGYAMTIPVYTLTLFFSVKPEATFAIVVPIGYAQLMVISGGSSGNNGRRRFARLRSSIYTLAVSTGNHGRMAKNIGMDARKGVGHDNRRSG